MLFDDVDGSADVPTYEAEHTVGPVSGVNKNISNEGYHEFWIKITGESGANYISGLQVLGVWISTKDEL